LNSKYFGATLAVEDKGKTVRPSEERKDNLPTLMAVWGSAFCVTPTEATELSGTSEGSSITGVVNRMIKKGASIAATIYTTAKASRTIITPMHVQNWEGLTIQQSSPQFESNEEMYLAMMDAAPPEDNSRLYLMDAGIACNIPVPPLLVPDRKVDLIIILDASESDPNSADTMLRTAKWRKKNHNVQPFPLETEIQGKNLNKIAKSSDTIGAEPTFFRKNATPISTTTTTTPAAPSSSSSSTSGPDILYIPLNLSDYSTYDMSFPPNRRQLLYLQVKSQWERAKNVLHSNLQFLPVTQQQ